MSNPLEDDGYDGEGASEHEPCPRCQKQPAVERTGSYWRAYCASVHFPGDLRAMPMKTKSAALDAWDRAVRSGALK